MLRNGWMRPGFVFRSPDGGGGDGDTSTSNGESGDGDGGQGHGDGGKTFTQEDVDRVVKQRLERERGKYADYEDLKASAAKLQEIEDAQLGEREKLEKRIGELEAKAADAEAAAEAREAEVEERLIRAEVRIVATTMGFVSPDDAFRLADLDGVKVAEDGSVAGVEKALKALVKGKPYLCDNGKGGVGTPPRGQKRGAGKPEPVPVNTRW